MQAAIDKAIAIITTRRAFISIPFIKGNSMLKMKRFPIGHGNGFVAVGTACRDPSGQSRLPE